MVAFAFVGTTLALNHRPNKDCADTGNNFPGNSGTAPGSAFNPDGTGNQHYAGSTFNPTNPDGPNPVPAATKPNAPSSQYDVSCSVRGGC